MEDCPYCDCCTNQNRLLHLVKVVASKGARIWEPREKFRGSKVRRGVNFGRQSGRTNGREVEVNQAMGTGHICHLCIARSLQRGRGPVPLHLPTLDIVSGWRASHVSDRRCLCDECQRSHGAQGNWYFFSSSCGAVWRLQRGGIVINWAIHRFQHMCLCNVSSKKKG